MTEIRDASPADFEGVIALDSELLGGDAWSAAAMAAEFAGLGESRTIVLASSGDALVGYAILLIVAETADLQRIGVAPAAQRAGIGSRLLETVLARAVDAGCDRVLLEVDAQSVPALAFYHRHGFAEIARRPGYYHDGADAIVMALDLQRRTVE